MSILRNGHVALSNLRVKGHTRREDNTMQHILPTGSEEREVLGVGSIPVAILPSCQDMKTITL